MTTTPGRWRVTMTPEAQRIAIAESVGFYVHHEGSVAYISRDPKPNWDHRVYQSCPMPRYTEDLNAMHEVEKTIPVRQIAEYTWILASHLDSDWADADVRFAITHATAAQRAEAYLKTIGRWQDEKDKG